ncbi:MAG: carboxymuconolactone decarboxylase family protein [Gemmatimonadetes bacterium]|nr:carboxymuconolactone decarboxylase family protein [Gemmatimonadota bacterium]
MPYIDIIPLKRATGLLKKQYEAALARAGRIWGIVSIMSLNPRAMKDSLDFYKTLMYGPSPLSRGRREMLAVVVSAANHCVY